MILLYWIFCEAKFLQDKNEIKEASKETIVGKA